MNEDLKKIKKIYGEEMMHLCRELFPTILTKPGLLVEILRENLAPTHSFAEDVISKKLYEQFKDWIYSFVDEKKPELTLVEKSPFELLDEKGYTLYECKTESDIQKFKKYYRPDELICTIKNGGRLERCYVFFAVKKNVDNIKREMFLNPKRDDEYGTSVISIQFSRGRNNEVSIKNRYNHTIQNENPDATFDNDLEKISKGLTRSFEEYYELNISGAYKVQDYFLTSNLKYVKAFNGKFYRYNLEVNGIYFCENNIVVWDGKVITEYADNKERYILIDQYVIDLKEKSIVSLTSKNDSFVKSINSVGKIESIDVCKNIETREIIFKYKNGNNVKLEIDKKNRLIGYYNDHVRKIDSFFMPYNKSIKNISLNNVNYIGDDFISNSDLIEKISFNEVVEIGDRFLYNASKLSEINLPKIKRIGNFFLYRNNLLKSISFPNAIAIGSDFLSDNKIIKDVYLPKVEIIGRWFLYRNIVLKELELPNVQYIGDFFLSNNRGLEKIDLPNVTVIGSDFLKYNYLLLNINFPKLEMVGDNFLYNNRYIGEAIMPKVKEIGNSFMYANCVLRKINFPRVKYYGSNFLQCNPYVYPELLNRSRGIYYEENDNKKNR